jgi:hypothetical protein
MTHLKIPNVILISPNELISRCFTRSEVENIIIEIKECAVHQRQEVLNFGSFNYTFHRQTSVIYNYIN